MSKLVPWLGSALFSLASTSVEAAENLACMDAGYSDTEVAAMNRFVENYSLADWQAGKGLPNEVENLLAKHVRKCADSNEWPLRAVEQAVYYKISALTAMAIDANTPLNSQQMVRLGEAYSTADRKRLESIMLPALNAIFAVKAVPPPSPEEIEYLNENITRRSGLPINTEITKYIGAWLLTRGMVDYAKQRFSES
ncbi:hypothetical protein [Sphingopyxis sp.]|jgi:hypothetical protein|uniref:hypothetical protein n=1 Tax=Sphingopyxis sp. TaxID=1908224 RepID=UPI002DF05A28|nr:hypothetical protein [Sphingopyxis sp.]